jgi:hypothetical protein
VGNSKLTPGNLTILIAGVVIFLASFLPFYKTPSTPSFDIGNTHIGGGSVGFSAWHKGLFFIGTLAAILGLVMAIEVALRTFAHLKLPDRIAGMNWNQIHLALGFQVMVLMFCWLIVDKGSLSFGFGFYLMLLAAIALLVGAIMRLREPASTL